MVWIRNMVDGSQQGPEMNAEIGTGMDEDALRSLFAQRLADDPLPRAVRDQLTARVLDEIHHNPLPAKTARVYSGMTFAARLERVRNWLRSLTPSQSLLLAGAGAIAALLLFVGISRVVPRPLSVTAEVSGGDATVLNWHSDKFRIQGNGDLLKLREGDQILTGDGFVRFGHLPDQVSVIEPGAHVELTRIDEADGGRQLALTVHDGVVHSRLNSPLQPQDLYIINTPGVTVSAVSTDFTVEAVSEEETLVTALSGKVNVTMGIQAVTIGPGEEVDAVIGRSLIVQVADGKYDGGLLPRLITLAAESGLQLYAQPRTDAALLGRLPAGRSVTIQAEDPGGGWMQICCIAGKPAWVQIR
jgi:hypothetical protein